jgi:hypothetical protein
MSPEDPRTEELNQAAERAEAEQRIKEAEAAIKEAEVRIKEANEKLNEPVRKEP